MGCGHLYSRFIKIQTGNRYGIISPVGKLLYQPQFDMMPFFDTDGICSVKKHFTEGWMDTTGHMLYFDKLTSFKDCPGNKMISYEVNGAYGFIDKTQVANIPLQYSSVVECFSYGLAKVVKDGQYEYIDRSGRVLASASSSAAMTNINGIILQRNNAGTSFINAKGESFKVDNYSSFETDCTSNYLLVSKNGKWGAVDRSGQLVVPCSFDEMSSFCNGYSIIKQKGKYGLFYNNKMVIEAKYDNLLDPTRILGSDCSALSAPNVSHVIYVSVANGVDKQNIVLFDGKTLFSSPYEMRVDKLVNGYAVVKTAEYGVFSNAKCALIGPKGDVLIKPVYSDIKFLSADAKNTYFMFKTSAGKCGVLNARGQVVVNAFADDVVSFDGTTVVAFVKGDRLCYDVNGLPILPKGFDVDGRVLKNKTTDKYGVVDAAGNIKIYPVYDAVIKVTPSYAVLSKDGKYGVLKY